MKILSRPKGAAEEYGRWSVNAYLGCPHQCQYCYLKTGPGSKTLGGSEPHLKAGIVSDEHAYHLAMAEILEHRDEIIRDGGLFMTFTSDPCIKETMSLFYIIAKEAISDDIPVTMLTKAAGIGRFIPEITRGSDWKYTKAGNLAIGWTLTGHDEMEPNAPTNAERICTMRTLSEDYICGDIHLWASIEPVIDFRSSYAMIQQALDAGCRHFKIGLQTKNNKVIRQQYDAAECMAFVQDVMQLTRDRATVYWKQSVRQFIGGTSPKHRLFTDQELHDIFDRFPHSVGPDWSMFRDNIKK